jgi:hypothetical protein
LYRVLLQSSYRHHPVLSNRLHRRFSPFFIYDQISSTCMRSRRSSFKK